MLNKKRFENLLAVFCLSSFVYYSFFTDNTHQLTFFGFILIALMLEERKD